MVKMYLPTRGFLCKRIRREIAGKKTVLGDFPYRIVIVTVVNVRRVRV